VGWEDAVMSFKEVSPFLKFRVKEQWSIAVLIQLGNNFRRKWLWRDGVRCS
jgi:hypothetical protein